MLCNKGLHENFIKVGGISILDYLLFIKISIGSKSLIYDNAYQVLSPGKRL